MALGLVLHLMVPGVFFGVKPDFLLSMMFISLMIVGDAKEAILIGVAGGIMSALTTGFPGGQIPNFIEKIITSLVVFYIINAMKDFDADKISGELDYLLAICKLKGLKKEDFIEHINKKWENKND